MGGNGEIGRRDFVGASGDSLPRLMKIKAAFDPKNIFRHAQSVPLELT